MSTDVGRGILAPRSGANIRDGAAEMRTLGATAASAINTVDLRVSAELAQKIGKTEAYEHLVPRDEAVRYGIPGRRGKVGPVGPKSDVPGPGGSIALEETDPGCFVDSEITWMQWPQSGGLPAVWNPNTQQHEQPIRVDTSVGTRVFVGDTMIHGDTGWRNVGILPERADVVFCQIRRENNTVSAVIQFSIKDSGSATFPAAVPSGYRAVWAITTRLDVLNSSTFATQLSVNSSGTVYLYRPRSGDGQVYAEINWTTNDSWPTTLPGTPV